MNEIYNKLIAQGELSSSVKDEYFENSLNVFFKNSLKSFYNNFLYEEYENFIIPKDYILFIKKIENNTISFIKIDHHIYGLYQMITYTSDYMHSDADSEEKPTFWLSIGHRNDRGNFFLCCDKQSDLYGQVCEFYDGSPFINQENSYKIGDFQTFCKAILNEGI